MLLFRKFLIRIKKEYNTNAKRVFTYSSLAVLLGILLGIGCDILLPVVTWGIIIRSVIMIPTAITMFILGYALMVRYSYRKTETDPEWVPPRGRLSPTWRRRVALIAAAFLLLIIYATDRESIVYTPVSSLVTAIGISLFAFIRTTREEAQREEFNIPDSRDIRYEQQIKKLEEAREEARNRKKERRKKVEEES